MTTNRLLAATLGAVLLAPIGAAPAAAASFLAYRSILVPSEADAVAIGDVTGDGRNDIVYTTGYKSDPANDFHLFVIAQAADGTLGSPIGYATAGTYPERPSSLDLGDVTGDGRTDVVVGLDRKGIQVFPGQAGGALGSPTFIATVDSTRVAITSLDGNPGLDVVGIGWGTNTVATFSGGPSGLTLLATYAAKHGGRDDMEIGDVTGDGRADIVISSPQNLASANFSVLPRLAAGGFGTAVEYTTGTGQGVWALGVGDVTGDGRKDVVVSTASNQPDARITVFPQSAVGTLGAPVPYASYDIPEPVVVTDIDGDGRNDVVTMHGGWQRAGVYSGLANGTLGPEQLFPVPYASAYNVQGVAVGDINGDGRPDIVEADYNNGLVLLINGMPPPPTPPAVPNLISLVTFDSSIKAFWDTTGSDGGSPFTSFTATASPGGHSCTILAPSCTITGLTNGTTYTITVHATNAIGSSAESNALSATPRIEPSPPRNLSAKVAGTGITLAWQAPLSNGGATITAYRVYRGASATSGTLIATLSGTTLSYVDKSAPKKVKSYYWVTAVNVVAESLQSNVVSATGR